MGTREKLLEIMSPEGLLGKGKGRTDDFLSERSLTPCFMAESP